MLLRSTRSPRGLYDLRLVGRPRPKRYDEVLSLFWQEYFGHAFGLWGNLRLRKVLAGLAGDYSEVYELMMRSVLQISRELARALSQGGTAALDAEFWSRGERFTRPLRGYCQMMLENSDYAESAWRRAMRMVELLISLAP